MSNEILADGPVGYWPLRGHTNDASGNGNDLTIHTAGGFAQGYYWPIGDSGSRGDQLWDTGVAFGAGDWTLEFHHGTVDSAGAKTLDYRDLTQGTLATFLVTRFDDDQTSPVVSGLGTLRSAITLANTNPGPDTIYFLNDGTYTLGALVGGDDDGNARGDLDVRGDLQIVGRGIANTTIVGNGTTRVFDLRNGTIELSSLTIQGGAGAAGAGVRIDTAATASMVDLLLRNNLGNVDALGGGIFNEGDLSLLRVTLSGNQAKDGAGVYSEDTLAMTDVWLDANEATRDGGGIFATSGSGR